MICEDDQTPDPATDPALDACGLDFDVDRKERRYNKDQILNLRVKPLRYIFTRAAGGPFSKLHETIIDDVIKIVLSLD